MIIREIQFVTEQEGWAWGTRIYHTRDQGQHWEDILDGLCRLAPHQYLDDCPFYSVLGEVNGQAVVLTNDLLVGGVGITDDVGKNWHLRSILKLNPFGYTEPVKIKRGTNQSLWFVTSTDSKEGMGGQLIHIGQDNSVHNYRFGVVITDAIFLPGNQILASGYHSPTNRIEDFEKRIGIILNSLDGGVNWDFVYNNKKVKSINVLQVTTENEVWAIGEKGLILKLVQNKSERNS